MKLTNQTRNAFVKAAMSDVPYVDYQTEAQTLAQNYLTEQMNLIFPGVDMEKAEPWLNQTSVLM